MCNSWLRGWRRGVVVNGVRQWTKFTHVGPGYNWDVWPSSGGYTISGCNQPTSSTQPCIPPGSLNRVPASAGVKAGMSPLPGDPIWHVSSRSGKACCELLYSVYFTLPYIDAANLSGTASCRAGFKGGGTGQLPRASTTKGPPQKNSKKLLPKQT